MNSQDIEKFIQAKNLPKKSVLSTKTEYKTKNFEYWSERTNSGWETGCIIYFYFSKPVKLGLNIKCNMSDFFSPSFLHKSMFAKKIETNLPGINCWGIKEREISLTLQQSSITNLLSELKNFLGIENPNALRSGLLPENGFTITDKGIYVMLSFDYNCDLEKFFDLLHRICSEMEGFWSKYSGGSFYDFYEELKSEKVKNLVFIVIILISILIFLFKIITELK